MRNISKYAVAQLPGIVKLLSVAYKQLKNKTFERSQTLPVMH